jgi:squalene monooxygenase
MQAVNGVHPYDMIVVGAGVAGATAAAVFGRQRRSVLLIERNLSMPDTIVGELMQPAGRIRLELLGLAGTQF